MRRFVFVALGLLAVLGAFSLLRQVALFAPAPFAAATRRIARPTHEQYVREYIRRLEQVEEHEGHLIMAMWGNTDEGLRRASYSAATLRTFFHQRLDAIVAQCPELQPLHAAYGRRLKALERYLAELPDAFAHTGTALIPDMPVSGQLYTIYGSETERLLIPLREHYNVPKRNWLGVRVPP